MTKPIKPITDNEGDNYVVSAVLDKNTTHLPNLVAANLRHLLTASELGHLVLVQCTRYNTRDYAYVLCAYFTDAQGKARLLPICEIEDSNDLLLRIRPPSALPENAFVKANERVNRVDVREDDNGELELAEVHSVQELDADTVRH